MSPKYCAYIVERLTMRFMAMVADHERQLTEHRAAFGARTEADAKIIAGLRSEIVAARMAVLERDSLMSERNGLLIQVQDMRAEMERLQWENATMHKDAEDGYAEAIKVLGDPIALSKERDALRAEVAALQERLRASIARGDFAQMEVAALKTHKQHGRWVRATSEKCTHAKAGEVVSVRGYLVRTNSGEFLWEGKDCEPCDPPQTEPLPKRAAHPVAVGGYLRRLTGFNTTPAGEVAQVTLVDDYGHSLEYEVARPNGEKGRWSAKGCEPCDPPATHDTEAGKAAAESAVRTEPVAEAIKIGNVVKVCSASGDNTARSDIGKIGEVIEIDSQDGTVLLSGGAGWVSRCDVRKVTT